MTHALERTSEYGAPFVGRCAKCGEGGLGLADALKSCPMDGAVSDADALLDFLKPAQKGKVVQTPAGKVLRE